MKNFLFIVLAAFSVMFISSAQADSIYTGTFGNTAVSGYDTVAYFTQNKPVKGQKKFSFEWNGANWLFSSEENLNTFKGNPSKYAPQYGGYCAFAVGHNALAPGDPNQWHIENGKLYLNLNTDIKQRWLSNKSELITQADRNYPGLVK